jgi:hypothetical protein
MGSSVTELVQVPFFLASVAAFRVGFHANLIALWREFGVRFGANATRLVQALQRCTMTGEIHRIQRDLHLHPQVKRK